MMMNRRLFLAGSASAAALTALAACAKNEESGGQDDSTANRAMNIQDPASLEDGGDLKIAIQGPIDNWNLVTAVGSTGDLRSIINWVSPYFVDWDADGTCTANPNFYSTFEAEEKDGKTVVTLELNSSAVWGSGRPIDSEDIKESLIHGKDESYNWAARDGLENVESVDTPSATRAVVTFDSVMPDWTNYVAGVSPKELMRDAETFNNSLAGHGAFNNDYLAGPYKIDSWDESGQIVTIVKNDKWWGDAPKIDTLTFQVLDPSAEATSFANKSLDYIEYIISNDVYTQCQGREDAEIRQNFGLQWRHFTFNTTKGILADQKVRQAIVRACDRAAIASSDLAGLPIETGDVLLGNRFFMPNQTGYQDNSGDWGYDVEAAKQLLEDAGWTEGADGIREKDGEKASLTFTYPAGTTTSQNEGALLQTQLEEVGIDMQIATVPNDQWQTGVLDARAFDLVAFTWVGTQYPMANIGEVYGTNSKSNYSDMSDPQIDDLITRIATEPDNGKRIELTNQVDVKLWEDVMNFPIYERPQFTAVPKKLANFGANGLSSFRPEHVGYMK
ncbi:ABC transporter family substrate-binding protein [Actinomyces sp. oral taxon 448]|jgi:ABC superfamily ATP binding cassette transporter, solute-binding protein|uniref:ABC transporter family substrate-binding protein n=1 Tax=Actinomyces sp. oral taxon 448 TaxID=712124 RepID=UPI0025B82495|nr:ABC transporter family substrate-binding protein [Actinomyces sp. oral taxon 448]